MKTEGSPASNPTYPPRGTGQKDRCMPVVFFIILPSSFMIHPVGSVLV
jgi:hypothetical protein